MGGVGLKTPRRRARRRWARYLLYALAGVALAALGAIIYLYFSYAQIIDARLHGERERSLPRVYARPVELRIGQSLTNAELVNRLNDLGFAQRPSADVS